MKNLISKFKSIRTRTKVVIFAIFNITVFTGICLWISLWGNYVPDELIRDFFYFWGAEMLALAGITVAKAKFNYNDNSYKENTEEILQEDIEDDDF